MIKNNFIDKKLFLCKIKNKTVPMQPYQEKVRQILELPWGDYSPYSIVMISLATAREFAESLRLALEVFPDDKNLKLMAAGVLGTTNLTYGNYKQLGDHWQFLSHFTVRFPHEASEFIRRSSHVTEEYLDAVRSMTDKERAMTIFSREQELPGIFKKILDSQNWEGYHLGFYRYYLEEHIRLDSEEGGHAELTQAHELNSEVLDRFYAARLDLYAKGLIPIE
ncbi:MAG: DUF3050 domain-containing protein [Candidatus Paceibacterota bacterium]